MKFIEYLSAKDLLQLRFTQHSDVIAEVISDKLKRSLIISKGTVYCIDDYNVYQMQGSANDNSMIAGFVCKFLSKSYLNLTEKKINKLHTKITKHYPDEKPSKAIALFLGIMKESFIKSHIGSIKNELRNDKITFDDDKNGIHFLNGRFNLKTCKMEQRAPEQYISQCIPRNYEEPKKSSIKYVDGLISKLFREIEAKSFILHQLGSSLSGNAAKQQKFLVQYGMGGAGKSTLLNMVRCAVSKVYFKMLSSDALSKRNSNINKIKNSFNASIRYYVINEADTSSLHRDLVKSIADGQINTTKLYRDGDYDIIVNGNLIFISNHMLTVDNDSGFNRRLLGYEYKNKFSSDDSEVDNKTVFKRDTNVFSCEFDDDIKNAIFYMLSKEAYNFLNNISIPPKPQCMIEFEEEMTSVNDYWGDFIANNFIKQDGGRISLTDILDMVRLDNTKKNIQKAQVLSSLKDKKVKYNKDLRVNGKRGVIIGYIWKDDSSETSTPDDSLIHDELQRLKLLLKQNNIKY